MLLSVLNKKINLRANRFEDNMLAETLNLQAKQILL